MEKTADEIKKCIERQRKICEPEGEYPSFAPRDGICGSCRTQIYSHPDKDGSTLVTGCPWCHRSYCD